MVDVGRSGGTFGRSGKGTSVPRACLTYGKGVCLVFVFDFASSLSCVVYEVSCILVRLCWTIRL